MGETIANSATSGLDDESFHHVVVLVLDVVTVMDVALLLGRLPPRCSGA